MAAQSSKNEKMVFTVKPGGNAIDAASAERIRNVLQIIIREYHTSGTLPLIVLDLGGIVQIVEEFAQIMLDSLNQAQQAGGNVKLADITPVIDGWLQKKNLRILFNCYKTVKEADASFQK